jgi:hypothetical protein
MSQNLIVKILGLNTNANQVGGVLPGSLSIAKNCNIDRDGIIESRRGFDFYPNPPTSLARFDRITEYQDHLIAHRSDNNTLNYYASNQWNAYNSGATFGHPDDDYARMRFTKTASNMYFTTSNGVKVLDGFAGPVYGTGMPKGLDGSASLNAGASGFMTDDTQVAYRVVWGTKDANNNLYLGAPSQRIIVANTSGTTKDVDLVFTIPDGITVDDFFQVYRSRESATASDEPNDELQLVYESNPTSGQITAKSVTFTDSVPNSLLGAFLYTNSGQEGLAQSNDEPPFAKDIALFKGFMFYANIKTKQRLFISLISVGGTSGIVVDDTITINGSTYTGKSAENIASAQFKIFTAGSPSQNIDDTARSLVKVINQYTSNTSVYAYYVSGYEELPGQILLEKRTITGSQFTVTASRASAWDLDDGQSDNESFGNGLQWSKIQQPEHVPAANLERIGSGNYEIRRILALRDSLFIFKDDGIFRLTGQAGTWSVDPLDTSTKLIAPDSAVVLNNQIYALTDQGVCAISDVGVEIKGIPIDDQIKELISIDYDKLRKLSFGVNYETDRKYCLFTIDSVDDTYPNKAFVFNTITNKWTTWSKGVTHGFVADSNDRMYLTEGGTNQVFEERKSFIASDFADERITGFNIVSYSTFSVVLDSTANIAVGDMLYQDEVKNAIVRSIDVSTNTVVVHIEQAWDIAAASVLKAIPCQVEFTNLTNENAGVMKHYQEIAWLFREKGFLFADTSFYTDLSGGYDDTEMIGTYGGGVWGNFLWGDVPWGGLLRTKSTRVFVPREKSRGSLLSIRLSVSNARSRWALNGLSLQFEFVSERMGRS